LTSVFAGFLGLFFFEVMLDVSGRWQSTSHSSQNAAKDGHPSIFGCGRRTGKCNSAALLGDGVVEKRISPLRRSQKSDRLRSK
jgi:hypothetical protein